MMQSTSANSYPIPDILQANLLHGMPMHREMMPPPPPPPPPSMHTLETMHQEPRPIDNHQSADPITSEENRKIVSLGKLADRRYVIDENNYVYSINNQKKISVLNCVKASKNDRRCHSKAVVYFKYKSGEPIKITHFVVKQNHNHRPDLSDIQSIKLKQVCFQRAATENLSFAMIFMEEQIRFPLANVMRGRLFKHMEKCRNHDFSKEPRKKQIVVEQEPEDFSGDETQDMEEDTGQRRFPRRRRSRRCRKKPAQYMDNLEIISFGTNTRCYVIDECNHVYMVSKIKKVVYLKCNRHNEKDACPATAYSTPHFTKGKLLNVTHFVMEASHNHESDVADAHNIKLQHTCFMKMQSNPDESFTKIFNEEREKYPFANESLADVYRLVQLHKENIEQADESTPEETSPKSVEDYEGKHLELLELEYNLDPKQLENNSAKENSRAEEIPPEEPENSVQVVQEPKSLDEIDQNSGKEAEMVAIGKVDCRKYVIDEDNFVYCVSKVRKTVYLLCIKHQGTANVCPGRALAYGQVQDIELLGVSNLVVTQMHNHTADVSLVHTIRLRQSCYERAETCDENLFPNIYQEEIERYPFAKTSYDSLYRNMVKNKSSENTSINGEPKEDIELEWPDHEHNEEEIQSTGTPELEDQDLETYRELEIISLGKIKKKYILDQDDHLYTISRLRPRTSYFHCIRLRRRGKVCKSRATAYPHYKNGQLSHFTNISLTRAHNHEPDKVDIDNIRLRKSCYERAETDVNKSFSEIYNEEIVRYPLANVQQKLIEKSMERIRNHSLDVDENGDPIGENYIGSNEGESNQSQFQGMFSMDQQQNLEMYEEVEIICYGDVTPKKYVIDGREYVYRINRTTESTVYLQCMKRKKTGDSCRATATGCPHMEGTQLTRITNFVIQQKHNHEPFPSNVQEIRLRNSCYERVKREKNMSLTKIFNEEIMRFPNANVTQKNIVRCMERFRTNRGVNAPKTNEEFHSILQKSTRFSKDQRGRPFYRLCITRDRNFSFIFAQDSLTHLFESQQFHVESTFVKVPDTFSHLLTIYVPRYDTAFPIAYALMTDHNVESYTNIFQFLNIDFSFHPKFISTSYDYELKQALHNIFPELQHRGCLFHYCQSIVRQMTMEFGNHMPRSEVTCIMHCIMAIPLLPHHFTYGGWQAVDFYRHHINATPIEANLINKMLHYVRSTFIHAFPYLSVYQSDLVTSFSVEAFHRNFSSIIPDTRPKHLDFLAKLQEIDDRYVEEFQLASQGLPGSDSGVRKIRRKVALIESMWESFPQCPTQLDFIKFLSEGGKLIAENFFPLPNYGQ